MNLKIKNTTARQLEQLTAQSFINRYENTYLLKNKKNKICCEVVIKNCYNSNKIFLTIDFFRENSVSKVIDEEKLDNILNKLFALLLK